MGVIGHGMPKYPEYVISRCVARPFFQKGLEMCLQGLLMHALDDIVAVIDVDEGPTMQCLFEVPTMLPPDPIFEPKPVAEEIAAVSPRQQMHRLKRRNL